MNGIPKRLELITTEIYEEQSNKLLLLAWRWPDLHAEFQGCIATPNNGCIIEGNIEFMEMIWLVMIHYQTDPVAERVVLLSLDWIEVGPARDGLRLLDGRSVVSQRSQPSKNLYVPSR